MSADPAYLKRMQSLAEAHLDEYDLDQAVDALFRVDDCTALPVPDDLLVEAVRRYLRTIDLPDGGDPCAALREVAG